MAVSNVRNKPAADTGEREIVITRLLNAPREVVWEAWTDPKQVVQWWGPRGFTTTIHEMDVRPGGVWRHTMHGPDGTDYPNKSVFKEVVKPGRIVFSHGGGKKGASGVSFEATWTFEAKGNKTLVTMRSVFPSAEARDYVVKEYGAIEGGKQTLDRLEEQLEKTPIVVERTFNATTATVWKALTDIEQMKQWYMPALESFRPEVGFETQFNIHHNGKDFLHIWKITEAAPGKRISYSWKYEGFPGESFVTFELFPEGNKTKLKLTHTGLETFLPRTNPDLARNNFLEGWTQLGTELQKFLDRDKPAVASSQEFVITRVFDAPRELVWKAWTNCEHLQRWWGPKDFSAPVCKIDLRVGGKYLFCMRSPEGQDFWSTGVYREILKPERLVYTDNFADAQGNVVSASYYGMPGEWPEYGLVTVTLEDQAGGKTKMTLRHRGIPPDVMSEMASAGWNQSFEKLAASLMRM